MESEEIRNIEQIIDNYHKNHSVWSGTKEQLIYDLLTTYGDICTCIIMAMVLNPFAAEKLTHNMDALNQALIWVEKSPLSKDNSDIKYNIHILITTEISQKLNHLKGKLTKFITFFSQKFTIQKIKPNIK